MRKIHIPFAEESSRIPLISFRIDSNHMYYALVDTGSESTLFDQNLKSDGNLTITPTDYKMSLIGLSGETCERRVMTADAILTIRDNMDTDNEVEVEGILSDLSVVSESIMERYGKHINVSVVIGSDFLKANGAKIDYRKKMLTLKRR